MNVVFVTHYYAPEETATADMLSGVAIGLAHRGLDVHVVTAHPSYHASKSSGRLPRESLLDGVRVSRVFSTRLSRHRPVGRLLNSVTFTIAAALKQMWSPRPAVVIAVTNPPTLPWVIALASFLRRTPLIILVHDVFPNVAEAVGVLSSSGWISRVWRYLNGRAFRRARVVVVLGNDVASLLQREYPCVHGDVKVIPNWADGDAIRPLAKSENALVTQWGAEKKFIVQYSGNFGRFHDIETILHAAEYLDPARYEFVFIGDGAKHNLIESAARRLTNVRLIPFQPKQALPLSLTACDVGLVSLSAGLGGVSVPSKTYGILAAGKPVIAIVPSDSDIAHLIIGSRCGIVTAPGDAEQLADAIRCLASDDIALKAMGKAARRTFERSFSLEVAVEAWLSLLRSVI